MGKRELLILLGFAVAGFVVYQVTAPPPRPGERSFSIHRMIADARRNMRRDSVGIPVQRSVTAEATSALKDLVILEVRGRLTVVGEDRSDIVATLEATVFGADDMEARDRARQMTLALTPVAESLQLALKMPPARRSRLEVRVRVPARLRVRVTSATAAVRVSGVAEAFVVGRGEVVVRDIPGAAHVESRDASVEIAHVGTLRLLARRGDVRVDEVRGEAFMDVTDLRLRVRTVGGPMQCEARRADVDVDSVAAPARILASDGRVTIREARAGVTVDGQRARVSVTLAAAAPLTLTTTDAPIEVLLPPSGGFTIDATAVSGDMRADVPGVATAGDDRERRASGAVRGGGPAVTLHATRGDITMR